MATIRITKEFHFEMAHALWGYDGLCRNVHGHSYSLFVTLIGKPNTLVGNPKLGMVMDFSDLKKIVHSEIITHFDHALVLNENSPHSEIKDISSLFGKIVFVDYQPTCENLLIDFSNKIRKLLPKEIKLHILKLKETDTSFAEWHAEDNE